MATLSTTHARALFLANLHEAAPLPLHNTINLITWWGRGWRLTGLCLYLPPVLVKVFLLLYARGAPRTVAPLWHRVGTPRSQASPAFSHTITHALAHTSTACHCCCSSLCDVAVSTRGGGWYCTSTGITDCDCAGRHFERSSWNIFANSKFANNGIVIPIRFEHTKIPIKNSKDRHLNTPLQFFNFYNF